jgi:hypothetical protein
MSVLIERAGQSERRAAASDELSKSPRVPVRDVPLEVDELEDTQPSVVLPEADDDFCDAPTIPGFRLRSDGSRSGAPRCGDRAVAEADSDREGPFTHRPRLRKLGPKLAPILSVSSKPARSYDAKPHSLQPADPLCSDGARGL